MLTQEEQDNLDFINRMTTENPSALTQADWELGELLEKKSKGVSTAKSPEEIKARGEEAYKQMMAEIGDIEKKASSYAGTELYRNPIGNLALSLLAPASAEAYKADRIPDKGDVAIDAGLAAASLYAAPARVGAGLPRLAPKAASLAPKIGTAIEKVGTLIAPTANKWANIAREGISSGLASGVGEGAISSKNDRGYDLLAPVIATGMGASLGGIGDYSKVSRLKEMGFTDDEIPSVLGKIQSREGATNKSLMKGAPQDIRSLGEVTGTEPVSIGGFDAGEATSDMPLKAPVSIMDDIAFKFNTNLKEKRLNGELSLNSYKDKIKEFDKFKEGIENVQDLDIQNRTRIRELITVSPAKKKARKLLKHPIEPELEYTTLLSELRDVKDPDVSKAIIETIDPEIGGGEGAISKAFNALQQAKKYETGTKELKPIVNTGTVAETVKNIFTEASPHGVEAARMLTAPVVSNIPRMTKKDVQITKTNKTNNPMYDENANIIYAPRGRITWDELMAD